MKRRTIKKLLRREERNLEESLKGFLTNANNETENTSRGKLNSALTYLLGTQLQLVPLWNHKQRWIDDVEWSSLSSSGKTLEGRGTIWWGKRAHVSGAMVPVEFEARLQLRSRKRRGNVTYEIRFESDGVKFCVCSRGGGY
jgi:hypothetical protein